MLVFYLWCKIILLNGLPVSRHVCPSHLLINSFVKFCNYSRTTYPCGLANFDSHHGAVSVVNDFCPFVHSPGLHGSFTEYTCSLQSEVVFDFRFWFGPFPQDFDFWVSVLPLCLKPSPIYIYGCLLLFWEHLIPPHSSTDTRGITSTPLLHKDSIGDPVGLDYPVISAVGAQCSHCVNGPFSLFSKSVRNVFFGICETCVRDFIISVSFTSPFPYWP